MTFKLCAVKQGGAASERVVKDRQDDKDVQPLSAILRRTMGQEFLNDAVCNLAQSSFWEMMESPKRCSC